MRMRTGLRKILLCAAALSVSLGPPAPSLLAQPRAERDLRIEDGEPSTAACEKLGYPQRASNGGYGRSYALAAPPPPPPPPPPIPTPPLRREQRIETPDPQSQALEEVVVTGSRAIRDGSRAPTPVTVMPGGRVAKGDRSPGRIAPPPAMAFAPPPQYDPFSERYPDAKPNAIHAVANEPVSTFSIDVDTASYSNVRRYLNDGAAPPGDSVRVEELLNYFDYGYETPASRETPFRPYVAVAPSPWAAGKQLIHIGVKGFVPPAGDEPPLNLVFLIDTSGSMQGEDRLELARKSLNVLIDQLRPQDSVAIVAYAGSAGAVLSPTSGRYRLKMRCALGALEAGGSTAGGAGLKLAYDLAQQNFAKEAVNRVILMTDGDFNVGVTDNARLEDFVAAKRKTGVYLSVYGFGRGNYQDARMQVLAQNGNGSAAYVDSLQEARKIFRDDFTGSMFPIADDVKIQVEFNPARVLEYRLIGYETRMLKREDFNNDKVDAGEVGAGTQVTALYEITPVGGRPSSDPLRYGPSVSAASDQRGELAFLKIRYKPPGGQTSRLIEQPINAAQAAPGIDRAPEATRFAAAVAAYGQKLRGDAYVGDDFTWDQVIALAQGAKGRDEFGLRAEFVNLARSARDLRRQNAGL